MEIVAIIDIGERSFLNSGTFVVICRLNLLGMSDIIYSFSRLSFRGPISITADQNIDDDVRLGVSHIKTCGNSRVDIDVPDSSTIH